jgi:tryptophan synthase alpha chain
MSAAEWSANTGTGARLRAGAAGGSATGAAGGSATGAAGGAATGTAGGAGRAGAAGSEGGAERIARAFARRRLRAALMPYLMAGFPSLELSVAIGEACVEAGADLLELGLPYSDPLADGPVIHEAGSRALAAGASLGGVLEVARALAARVPVVLMCYANMVLAPGAERFVERVARAGASGLIVPDLPVEESGELRALCDASSLALVPLAAPTSTPERLQRIASAARGFLYLVSVTGTTGERAAMAATLPELVARAKQSARVPVAVGFGVSNAKHARQVADAGADGVIVGTRLVRAAGEAQDPGAAVAEALAEIASGLRAAG